MPAVKTMPVNIGIEEKDRKEIADSLGKLLADTYTLYLKTQNYHWNVTGPMFESLHAMFEDQYKALADATDTIAERIRALGFPAPGSFGEFGRLASIHEERGVHGAEDMVRLLVEGHEAVSRTARQALAACDRVNDAVTVDLLTQRLTDHEKTAWMLRSILA